MNADTRSRKLYIREEAEKNTMGRERVCVLIRGEMRNNCSPLPTTSSFGTIAHKRPIHQYILLREKPSSASSQPHPTSHKTAQHRLKQQWCSHCFLASGANLFNPDQVQSISKRNHSPTSPSTPLPTLEAVRSLSLVYSDLSDLNSPWQSHQPRQMYQQSMSSLPSSKK
jgi:hypothetical protein